MLIIRLAVFATVKKFEYYSTVNMTSTYTLYILKLISHNVFTVLGFGL